MCRVLAFLVFGTALTCAAQPAVWNLERLSQPPQTYPAPDYVPESPQEGGPEMVFTGKDVQSLFYEGLPWQGKPTRVFAFYGLPAHKEGEKVPGMVLIHGGGGTAIDEWVRIWNRRGYAAISMDVTGTRPGGKPGERPAHEWAGPFHYPEGQNLDWPAEDQWVYHAVADAMLANSFLRAQPEVDPERIGVTGISWGGFLTCIVSGVDPRFKFAVPVYGCGFHNEAPCLQPTWQAIGPELAQKWFDLWDPSQYLKNTAMPTLWITGSNDFFAPVHTHAKSFDLVTGPKDLCVPVGMSHSHVHGWAPPEIYAYADSILQGGVPLARVVEQGRENGQVWARFDAQTPIRDAVLVYTADTSDWVKCPWQTIPARIDYASNRIAATIPTDCRAYYFNLTDERDLLVSSRVVLLP
ncbi:MAG: hypothetical protein QG656_2661 [Candidatus Hydrogenedentes bacterium]|nr:hypothetical protein [Candidatus Hydrogenedentota bacterium]